MILAMCLWVFDTSEVKVSEMNYSVITRATCEASYRESALELMGGFADDLREQAAAELVRYGYFGTGPGAGDLFFVQNYQDLAGFDKAQEVYASSSSYKSFFQSGKASIVLRNIIKILPISFESASAPSPKYLVLTKAAADPANKDSAINHVQQAAGISSENGL